METNSLLNALSPQLQALVEASLGAKLSPSTASSRHSRKNPTTNKEPKTQQEASSALDPTYRAPTLNPSELFALKHPESPGFVVKEGFLGRQNALAVRDALTELAQSEAFHEAKVGAGENLRNDRSVRGDKILWIQTPSDLNTPADGEKGASPAVLRLRRQVEALVHGLKKVSPELDLRNVVSTQFAIFPGDGARFVKHLDTYSNAQRDERGVMSKDGLVRLVTCVYYLNDEWEPDHGGELRVHLKDSKHLTASHWDVPPKLDTLMVDDDDDTQTYLEKKYAASQGTHFQTRLRRSVAPRFSVHQRLMSTACCAKPAKYLRKCQPGRYLPFFGLLGLHSRQLR
ncbi:c transferase [Phytophthora cinnamomi]|uniref:c transferase n=1 Tax=Phytophthora cinnamomi TaxID=4785 RepID=UPI00355AC3FE|nr:c transferase [Phytophthora cinnamomi]